MISGSNWVPPMAELEQKGLELNLQGVIMTSNRGFPDGLNFGMNTDAIRRRLHNHVIIIPNGKRYADDFSHLYIYIEKKQGLPLSWYSGSKQGFETTHDVPETKAEMESWRFRDKYQLITKDALLDTWIRQILANTQRAQESNREILPVKQAMSMARQARHIPDVAIVGWANEAAGIANAYLIPSVEWREKDTTCHRKLSYTYNLRKEKVWKVETRIDADYEKTFDLLSNAEKMAEWNETLTSVEVLRRVGEVDVIRIRTWPAIGNVISAREFVDVRKVERDDSNGTFSISNMSVDLGFKPARNHTRGFNMPSLLHGRKTLDGQVYLTWIVQTKLGGFVPDGIVDLTMKRVSHDLVSYLYKHLHRIPASIKIEEKRVEITETPKHTDNVDQVLADQQIQMQEVLAMRRNVPEIPVVLTEEHFEEVSESFYENISKIPCETNIDEDVPETPLCDWLEERDRRVREQIAACYPGESVVFDGERVHIQPSDNTIMARQRAFEAIFNVLGDEIIGHHFDRKTSVSSTTFQSMAKVSYDHTTGWLEFEKESERVVCPIEAVTNQWPKFRMIIQPDGWNLKKKAKEWFVQLKRSLLQT